MRLPPRLVIVVLLLSLLGVGGYAYWEHQLRLAATEALLASDRDRASLRQQLWARQQAAESAKQEAAAEATRRRAEGPPLPDQPDQRPGNLFNRFNQMMDNPEAQRLLAIQQKASLDSKYSALFRSLHLTPDQLEKFKSLLVEKQNAVIDVMAAARAQGVTGAANRAELTQMIQSAQAEVDTTILNTLGAPAFSQYQNFEQTLPQRNTVGQLDARLSYTDQPLTPQQTDQLVQILASNSPAPKAAAATGAVAATGVGGRLGGVFGTGNAPITDAAVAQAQSVLAPTQVQALQQLQQEQQAQAALRQLMRNPAPSAPPVTPVPPKG